MTEADAQPLNQEAVSNFISGGSPEEQAQAAKHFRSDPQGHIAGMIVPAMQLFRSDQDPGAIVQTVISALQTRPYFRGQERTVLEQLNAIVEQKRAELAANGRSRKLVPIVEGIRDLYETSL